MNSESIDRLGWTLVNFLWEGAAVALLLGVLLLVTRGKSPTLRYGLSCLALVGLAICPIATYIATLPPRISGGSVGAATIVWSPVDTGHWSPGAPLTPAHSENYLSGIVLIWIIGVAVLTLRLFGGMIRIERLKRKQSSPISAEWQATLDRLAKRLGYLRPVLLLESARVDVPVAMGALRAVIILPVQLTLRLSSQEVEAILLHELAHLRRHDYLVNIAQTVIETALFYHPAVWWISRTIRIERENCCDDIAASASASPFVYARALTALEEVRGSAPNLSLSSKGGHLVTRINRILGTSHSSYVRPRVWSAVALALMLTAVLGTVVNGAAQSNAPDAGKTAKKSISQPKAKLTLGKNPAKAVNLSAIKPSTPSRRAVLPVDQAKRQYSVMSLLATANNVRAAVPASKTPVVATTTPAERSTPLKPKSTVDGDFLNEEFGKAMQTIARQSGISYVLSPSLHSKVSVKITNVPLIEAINAICYAGEATWRRGGDIYYFEHRTNQDTITDRITLHLKDCSIEEVTNRVAGLLGARIELAVDKRISFTHVDLDNATVEDAMFYIAAFAGHPGNWHVQDGVYTITDK